MLSFLPQTSSGSIDMARLLGKHAVVVGTGLGGLTAAAALAPHFRWVRILERDVLPLFAEPRAGTPQDRHPHGLLAGGLRALESLFPGFEAELSAAGAVPVRVAQELRWERPDVGLLPQRDVGFSMLCASRPLIERALRQRVVALPNVELWPGVRVREIEPAPGCAGAATVRFDAGHHGPATLHADLVVDASGRSALTLGAIDALGWRRPEVTEIGVDIRYASVVVPVPDDAPRDWRLLVTQPDPPALPRNAALLPAEGNRWMVMLADRGAGAWPKDWPSFLEALRGLTTPTLHEALRYAEPPAAIRHYVFTASVWRHFERLPHLPRGVLPLGDALCRFNPVYGQGMSAAAQQALLLRDCLECAEGPDPLAAAQAGFMAAVPALLETPWNMAAVADFAFEDTRGDRPEGFAEAQQFQALLFRAAVADPAVHACLAEVMQLLRPSSDLQSPEMQQRVEAAMSTA